MGLARRDDSEAMPYACSKWRRPPIARLLFWCNEPNGVSTLYVIVTLACCFKRIRTERTRRIQRAPKRIHTRLSARMAKDFSKDLSSHFTGFRVYVLHKIPPTNYSL